MNFVIEVTEQKVAGKQFKLEKIPVVRFPHEGGQFDIQYWMDQWVMSFYAMYDVMYVVGKPWIIYSASVDLRQNVR